MSRESQWNERYAISKVSGSEKAASYTVYREKKFHKPSVHSRPLKEQTLTCAEAILKN